MSPLLAGSIGTGIGSLLQGDSVGDALKKGITGYGIGWGMGKLGQAMGMGGNPGAGLAVDPATGAVIQPGMGDPALFANGAPANPMAGAGDPAIWSSNPPVGASAAPAGDTLMSKYLTSTATGLQGGAPGAGTQGMWADRLMAGATGPWGSRTPAALGAALGPGLLYPNMPGLEEEEREWVGQSPPAERTYQPAPAGYRPGVDPEHYYYSDRYPAPSTMYANTGGYMVDTPGGSVPLSPGGVADIAAQGTEMPSDRDLVTMAYAALRGELPAEMAEPVLMQFVQVHGEDALMALVEQVESGGAPAEVTPMGPSGTRMVEGAGATDMIPASLPAAPPTQLASAGGQVGSEQHVLLDDGEVVIPAEAVRAAGAGDRSAGAAKLAGLAEILMAA